MKSTDIAMLVLVSVLSILAAYGAVTAIPGLKMESTPVKVKTIEKYSADIAEPDPTVFNEKAINPTVNVTIGGESDSSDEDATPTTDTADEQTAPTDDQ